MKHITEFIERHKKFIKKLIIFFIAYFVLVLVNNTELTTFFNSFFGETISTAFNAAVPTVFMTMEV